MPHDDLLTAKMSSDQMEEMLDRHFGLDPAKEDRLLDFGACKCAPTDFTYGVVERMLRKGAISTGRAAELLRMGRVDMQKWLAERHIQTVEGLRS